MNKHTPGPWKVTRSGVTVIVEGMFIADCDGATGESEANARLIAAAPELLGALKAVIAEASGQPKPCEHNFDCVCATDAARAAIAKAEGNT